MKLSSETLKEGMIIYENSEYLLIKEVYELGVSYSKLNSTETGFKGYETIKRYKIVREAESLGNTTIDLSEPILVTCKKTGEKYIVYNMSVQKHIMENLDVFLRLKDK